MHNPVFESLLRRRDPGLIDSIDPEVTSRLGRFWSLSGAFYSLRINGTTLT